MGDGTKENPYTREDVEKAIKEHGGTASGLDLSGKAFEAGIDLRGLNLKGIILERAVFSRSPLFGLDNLPPDVELYKGEGLLSSIRDIHLEGVTLERANLKEANLGGAHLEGADLTEARLEGAILTGSHLNGADLIGTNLEGADLEYTNLEGANLYSAKFEGAYLADTKFSRDTNFTSVDWGDYILACELTGEFETAEDTYRRLKQWYTNAGIYDVAGEFFYREMEAKRNTQSWKKKPHLKLWSWVLKLLCGYGEKPLRVIVWAASVMVGLALIYFIIGSIWAWSAFWNSLYFSAVSFTALGYGSWLEINNDWIRGIGAFESFIGVFSIALFLVTFVRKMTR